MSKMESSIEKIKQDSLDSPKELEGSSSKALFISLDVDSQIKVLQESVKDAREEEKRLEPTMSAYLSSLKDSYEVLKGEDAKKNLLYYFGKEDLPYFTTNAYIFTYKNKKTKIFFGIVDNTNKEWLDATHREFDDSQCKKFLDKEGMPPEVILAEALHSTAERYIRIWEHCTHSLNKPEFYIKDDFSVRLENIENFQSQGMGGDTTDVPYYLVNSLAKRANSGDVCELKKYMSYISSQYAHELVHYSLDEDGFDNKSSQEELTQMAEFLYDPLHDHYSNEALRSLAKDFISGEDAKKSDKWSMYHEAMKKFVLPTLLYELNQHNLIKLPIPDKDIPKVLLNLPEYYAQLSKSERDSIVEKYIVVPYEDMLKLGQEYYEMSGMKSFQEGNELLPQKTIAEVQPIQKTGGFIRQRDEIKRVVEEPLIKACEKLYDLNIKTVMSSANTKDIERGFGYIDIDFNSLSDANKFIVQRLIQEGKAEPWKIYDKDKEQYVVPNTPEKVKLKVPLTQRSTVNEISEAALSLAGRFVKQHMSWVYRVSLENIGREWHVPELDKMSPKNIEQETGYYYDSNTQTFFLNKEQYLKYREII